MISEAATHKNGGDPVKRLLILMCAAASLAHGAVQQTLNQLGTTGNWALTFYWTAASNGTVTTTPAKLPDSAQGMRILLVETVPGSPAPTAGYAAQFIDALGGDIMTGTVASLSATSVQFFSASSATPPLLGTFSLSVTGNSVPNAQGRIIVYFGPTTLVNATAGAPGPSGPVGPAGPSGPAGPYNFADQTPGGTLTAATPATVTLTPCPLGVAGTDTQHYLWVYGGTGTAETVLITGGTCTSGATTGTVIFTPANNHTGSWLIRSASGGIQEAWRALYSIQQYDISAMYPVIGNTASGQPPASSAIRLLPNRTMTGLPTVTFGTLGAVPLAGFAVYCTDCATVATCAGSGAGHLAVSNGTNWTCQ